MWPNKNTIVWNKKIDWVILVAFGLAFAGGAMLLVSLTARATTGWRELIEEYRPQAISLLANGILLLLLYRILRRQERERILDQMGSEGNEFALDAVKQIRRRGWLNNGALRGRDFSHGNLSRAVFCNANLHGARLYGANLRLANLMAADLSAAELRGANLRRANLRWANLEKANLEGADLSGADLRFANLSGAAMSTTILEEALIDEPLSPREIELVQNSFHTLALELDDFTKWFYFRLFYLDPGIKNLFLGGMRQQRKKFIQTIEMIIASLHEPRKIVPVLQSLGRRHLDYGIKNTHYQTLGEALLWAMEKKLNYDFSDELKNAWIKTYQMIRMIMTDAASDESLKQTARPKQRRFHIA
jgi:hemoglobin-like flavoprotein